MLPNLALQQLHRSIADISENAFSRPQHRHTAWSTHQLSLYGRSSLHAVSIRDAAGRKHRCLLLSDPKRCLGFSRTSFLPIPKSQSYILFGSSALVASRAPFAGGTLEIARHG